MPPDNPRALRQLADQMLASPLAPAAADPSAERLQPLLHELRVHQIELELQNEQLRCTQLELELERSRYFDLYDLAPVAYVTLSDTGLILQANLTAATLFGIDRAGLLKRGFFRLVSPADQRTYHHHQRQLIASGLPQTCQLRLVKADGSEFWGHVVSTLQPDPDGRQQQRVVLSDISVHKQLGQADRKAELASSLLQGQEQFKRRFAHDLHDRTSANLAALRLNLELIIATATQSRDTQAFSDCVADTWALLEDTNAGIRDLCADLYPSVFELGGLSDALQSYARSVGQRTGLVVHISCTADRLSLHADIELALFRIVQEALTNCAKHAQARQVTVSLHLTAWPVQLSIVDDGSGFIPSGAEAKGRVPGQGLRHICQTVEFLNGHLWIDSVLGQGTQLRIEIPQPTAVSRA